MISCVTDQGHKGSMLFQGGLKSQDFCGYISKLKDEFNGPFVLLIDGASIHRSCVTYSLLDERITTLYNIEYEKESMMIEKWFAKVKYRYKKSRSWTESWVAQNVMKSTSN